MASGTNFNLTDKRKKTAVAMFKSQHTVSSVAQHFGITYKTLQIHLETHGLDYKAIRANGKVALRSTLFDAILQIKDTNKMVDTGLRYLNQYPIQDEEIQGKSNVVPSDSEILDKIRKELDV